MSRRRERKVISSLRTGGRYLRLARRANGQAPALTLDEARVVVRMLKRAVRGGKIDGREAVRPAIQPAEPASVYHGPSLMPVPQ